MTDRAAVSALSPLELDAYLARIGQPRPQAIGIDALRELHRAHLHAFTWEGVDAFMGWPNALSPKDAFAKMVLARRGGWCFEMNGLFGAALAALGFEVTRLCGGVRRADFGDQAIGNHLTLRVDLDRPYLAEVGLGDAIMVPVPMQAGPFEQNGFGFAIEAADGDWWRFRNHRHGLAPSFDFRPDFSDEPAMVAAHGWLMSDAASPFTANLLILRHFPDRIEGILNTTHRVVTADGVVETPIAGLSAFHDLLTETFALDLPEPAAVWRRAEERGVSQLAA